MTRWRLIAVAVVGLACFLGIGGYLFFKSYRWERTFAINGPGTIHGLVTAPCFVNIIGTKKLQDGNSCSRVLARKIELVEFGNWPGDGAGAVVWVTSKEAEILERGQANGSLSWCLSKLDHRRTFWQKLVDLDFSDPQDDVVVDTADIFGPKTTRKFGAPGR